MLALFPFEGRADWHVIRLHSDPVSPLSSYSYGTASGEQAGMIQVSSAKVRACIWRGSPKSRIDLQPFGAEQSFLMATDGKQQVGFASFRGQWLATVAGLWSGTAGSWVCLDPIGTQGASRAYGVDNGRQIGSVDYSVDGDKRAVMWSGTAASMASLHPAAAWSSEGFGIQGESQVGQVTIERVGEPHASLWRGTPGSWIDLHPAGTEDSTAYAVFGNQQVGYVNYGKGVYHAALWSGSAQSWIDLHPGGDHSMALAVWGGLQVGYVDKRASLWSGTPGSWIDLNTFLPPVYSSARATDIRVEGDIIYISGYGYNKPARRTEALMWVWTP